MWQKGPETRTYATELKKAGYVTMYSGKYLNTYGSKASGGVEHVPPGWDFWSGLVGNSKYYNYTLSINGKAERHGDSYEDDYLTDVIGRKAQSFLNHFLTINSTSPFLMVLAPPAPHAPFTPAPQYSNHFLNHTAPRTPAFNHKSDGSTQKHWLIQSQPQLMSPEVIATVDEAFRNRWRTLLSVDDLVDGVLQTLDQSNLLKDTVVVFTSDHGYHLGQFGLPLDKRQLYETDLRVPLLVRGPGIVSNTTKGNVVTNIDLAPTLIELGMGRIPVEMDGASFVHLIRNESNFITPPQPQHSFLVEYHGEGGAHGVDQQCRAITDQNMVECGVQYGCKCQDVKNNTFSCVRTFSQSEDTIYCHFLDDVGFIEMYNLKQDPFQLYNIGGELTPEVKSVYEEKIQTLKKCQGREECFQA